MLRFLFVAEAEFVVDETAAAKQLGEAGQAVVTAAIPALERVGEWSARRSRMRCTRHSSTASA